MATLNITNRYNNRDKRFAEAVVISLPSQLEEGGVRLSTPPVLAQFGDDYVASVVEPDTVVQIAYLVVDEAFAASSTVTVTVGTTALFTDLDITSAGLNVSAVTDELVTAGADITITPGGGTGDIEEGALRVVLETVSMSLKNGNYAVNAS